MSWITVKVVKTRGAEEFWFCAELELAAESRGLHAAREAIAAAELAPSKVSADLRDRRGLQVRRDCGFATVEICVERCFIVTSLKDMRASSYGAESKKLIA
jgi:hypothetical protein